MNVAFDLASGGAGSIVGTAMVIGDAGTVERPGRLEDEAMNLLRHGRKTSADLGRISAVWDHTAGNSNPTGPRSGGSSGEHNPGLVAAE